jgi:hypothetical protein
MKNNMRSFPALVLCPLLIALASCDSLSAPDFNNPGLEEFEGAPNRTGILNAATGLLIGTRTDIALTNGYVSVLGIIGRESYNMDGADPRFVSQLLVGPLTPNAPAFGGNLWENPYRNIRNANVLLNGVDAIDEVLVDATEKEAIRGFAKTIQALDFLNIVNTRDTNCGCPVDVNQPFEDGPAPNADRRAVFDRIEALLDEAKGHLQAGGGEFPFPLSSGFTGFDTPTTFLQFNRALKARVDVYMATIFADAAKFSDALQALSESFLIEGGPLDAGVYHTFSTGSGDITNELFDPGDSRNLGAHPSIEADAQLKGDATPDDRFLNKIERITPRTFSSPPITTDLGFSLYSSNTAAVPIIRNEELILLRAEANMGLGDVSGAADDINLIRTTSGGLDERSDLDAGNILDELLYNRRYSLLWEGGHRWIDARRYGRLGDLPLDQPNHTVHPAFPIPIDETNARG